jgi:hypothetical protein
MSSLSRNVHKGGPFRHEGIGLPKERQTSEITFRQGGIIPKGLASPIR